MGIYTKEDCLREIGFVSQATSDIKYAIRDKGVRVPDDAPLYQYADFIREIETGGGTDLPSGTEISGLEVDFDNVNYEELNNLLHENPNIGYLSQKFGSGPITDSIHFNSDALCDTSCLQLIYALSDEVEGKELAFGNLWKGGWLDGDASDLKNLIKNLSGKWTITAAGYDSIENAIDDWCSPGGVSLPSGITPDILNVSFSEISIADFNTFLQERGGEYQGYKISGNIYETRLENITFPDSTPVNMATLFTLLDFLGPIAWDEMEIEPFNVRLPEIYLDCPPLTLEMWEPYKDTIQQLKNAGVNIIGLDTGGSKFDIIEYFENPDYGFILPPCDGDGSDDNCVVHNLGNVELDSVVYKSGSNVQFTPHVTFTRGNIPIPDGAEEFNFFIPSIDIYYTDGDGNESSVGVSDWDNLWAMDGALSSTIFNAEGDDWDNLFQNLDHFEVEFGWGKSVFDEYVNNNLPELKGCTTNALSFSVQACSIMWTGGDYPETLSSEPAANVTVPFVYHIK